MNLSDLYRMMLASNPGQGNAINGALRSQFPGAYPQFQQDNRVRAVGQADPGALEAYRAVTGMYPTDMARMNGRLPPVRRPMPTPAPQRQYFGNDWGGMQSAVNYQNALNYGMPARNPFGGIGSVVGGMGMRGAQPNPYNIGSLAALMGLGR